MPCSIVPISPMSWYIGSQPTIVDSASAPKIVAMARSLCIRFAWLTITPLGVPVEPDVY